jgi:hypothetical protein
VTRGSSSATNSKTPPSITPPGEPQEPEYSTLHHIDLEIRDCSGTGFVQTRGLLNSGSQGSCINQVFSNNVLTIHKLKPSLTTVIMADGNYSPAGPITRYDTVTIRIAGHEEQLALDTMSLAHPIILGMPWHRLHNPCIEYQNNTLTFDSESCRQHCDHHGKTIPLHPQDLDPTRKDISTLGTQNDPEECQTSAPTTTSADVGTAPRRPTTNHEHQ